MKKTPLSSAIALAVTTAWLAVPARADNIVLNQWYTGSFGASDTPLQGGAYTLGQHGPIEPWPDFGNAVVAPNPAWVITLEESGTLTVTDVETSGDRFQLFDNGSPAAPATSPFWPAPQNPGQTSPGNGLTSNPVPYAETGVEDINYALGDANYSSATFLLYPGVNVITGEFLGVVQYGDFNFIAEPVPEPASLALLASSLLGFGLIRRRRA